MTKVQKKEKRVNVQRTLIIGLGGTGGEVIARLRKLIVDHYGSLDKLPIIEFLYIDTNTEWIDRLTQEAGDDVRLTDSQIVNAEVPDTSDIYSGIEKGNNPHYSWYDYQSLKSFKSILDGAGTVRQLGRFCFWKHQATIENSLKGLINKIIPDGYTAYMQEEHQQTVDNGINVHIISSVAGGTGSGMFLDMAFLARHVIKKMGVQDGCQCFGHFVLPGAFTGAKGANPQANGYAALKELNYFSYRYAEKNPLAVLFGEPQWSVDYTSGNGKHVEFKNQMPFDCTYLLDIQNGKKTLDRDKIFTMLAGSLFYEISSDFAANKRSLRANINKQITSNDSLDCPAWFMSMGMSSIHLPARKIQDLLKHTLALRAVRQWIDKNAEPLSLQALLEDDNARESVSLNEQAQSATTKSLITQYLNDTFLPHTSFQRKDLLSAVTSNGTKDFKHVVAKLESDIQKKWIKESWKPDLFKGHLIPEWEHWQQMFSDDSPDQNLWGDQMKQLVSAQQNAIPLYRKKLYAEAMGAFKDSKRGAAWALAFLEGMQGCLTQMREMLIAEANNSLKLAHLTGIVGIIDATTLNESVPLSTCALQWTDEELQKLDDVIKESKGFKGLFQGTPRVRPQAERYMKWCGTWCKTKVEERSRRLAAEICSILINDIDKYKEQVRNVAAAMASLQTKSTEKARQWAHEAAATPVVGKLLFDPIMVEGLENRIKELRGDAYNPETIGAKALASTNISLDKLNSQNVEALLESLLNEAELAIGDLSQKDSADTDFAAYDILSRQCGGDESRIRQIVSEAVDTSLPFVQLHAPDTGGWTPGGDFPEGLLDTHVAGIRGGYIEKDSDLERVSVLKALDGMDGWNSREEVESLRDNEQIVFAQECGGFPLRALAGIDTMKEAYENHRKNPQSAPLHIVRDDIADATFPDIIPPSQNDLERAQQVYHVGTALGGIVSRNFETDGTKTELLSFIRTDSFTGDEAAVALGDRKASVTMKLAFDTPLTTEIEDFLVSNIDESDATTRVAIAEKLKQYLAELKKEVVKAKRDPSTDFEYQKVSKLVKSFATDHQLTP